MQYGLFLYLCVSENLIILKYKFFWESSDWNVVVIVVVQSLSHVWLFVTPWTAARQASLSLTISLSLLKLISIESVMPSNHLVICRPLLLLPSIFPSIRVISNESALHIRWPMNWSFSFSISPSSEYSGLMLKLKFLYFGHLMHWADSLEKTLMLGKSESRRRRGQKRMR